MKKLITPLLLLLNVSWMFSQSPFTVFTDLENTVIKDIIKIDEYLWLYIDDYNTGFSKILKVNETNEIVTFGPEIQLLDDWEDIRWQPCFLGADEMNNVYFYSLTSADQAESSLTITKINSEGESLWLQTVDNPGWYEIISNGQIFGDAITCVGMTYTFDEELYQAFAFSISTSTGEIFWQQAYEFEGFSTFSDIQINSTGTPYAILTGFDWEENYYTNVVTLNANGSIDLLQELPESLFGNQLELFSNNQLLITGFGEEGAKLIHYQIDNQTIVFDKLLLGAFDDLDVAVFKIDENIITLHTTYLNEGEAAGSGVEMMVNIFDLNGNRVDSLFFDDDTTYETQLLNAVHTGNGRIYFCGLLEKLDLFDPGIKGYWGSFNVVDVLMSIEQDKLLSTSAVNVYPTIMKPGERIYVNSENVIQDVFLIDSMGKLLYHQENNANSCDFMLPTDLQGSYYLVLSDANKKIHSEQLFIIK